MFLSTIHHGSEEVTTTVTPFPQALQLQNMGQPFALVSQLERWFLLGSRCLVNRPAISEGRVNRDFWFLLCPTP